MRNAAAPAASLNYIQAYWQEQWRARQIQRDKLVFGLILLERFTTRLLSEKLEILPGWTNFLDYPLLILFAVYVLAEARHRPTQPLRTGYGALSLGLTLITSLSAIINLDRLNLGAFLLFFIGLMEPLAYMALAYALAPDRKVLDFILRLLILVGWAQILVVAFVDLPVFLETRNPDFISGTFGLNAYQLVFYLLAWNVLILSPSEKSRYSAFRWIAVFLTQLALLIIILLAQFRAFIPSLLLTWLFTYLILYRPSMKTFARVSIAASLPVVLFLAINRIFPELKYQDILQLPERTQEISESGKIEVIRNYVKMVGENPQVLLIGTGPGTFLSRGFRVFSIYGKYEVANQVFRDLFDTSSYLSDVAKKYIVPITARGLFTFGAATTSEPWFSHLAILAELGLIGYLIVMATYFQAARMSWRMTSSGGSTATLSRWVLVAIFILLQLGFVGEWLEVTRVTIPIWLIFGALLAGFQNRGGNRVHSRESTT